MARRSPDGESRLVFAATLANPAAPTVAELNAAVDLTPFLLEWNFPESGNTVDTSDMASSFNKTDAGTYGGDAGTLTGYKDDVAGDDLAWTALPRLTRGFFVERLFGGADAAFQAGATGPPAVPADRVSIYPGVVTARSPQPKTRNTPIQFEAMIAITGEPKHDVTVVTGGS
jgi:hypothetical protein